MRAVTGVRSLIVAVLIAAAVALVPAQAPQPTGTWAGIGAGGAIPHGGAAVALADGRTLILGGVGNDEAPTSAALLYDPTSRTTIAAGALLFARTGHSATVLSDGRVVVSGGVVGGLVTGDVEIFDLATGTSSLAAVLPEPRRGHAAARLAGDAVLIAGGSGVDGTVLRTAVVLDVATGAVTPLDNQLSLPRTDASATRLIDGRVLVAGGSSDGSADGSADLSSAEIYDPFAQTFSLLTTAMSVPRRGHAAILLPDNASVLIGGGTSNGVVQSAVDLFLPAEFPDPYSYGTGHFAPTGAMTAARAGGVTTPAGVEGYAIADGGGAADAEVYRFATIRTDKDDYAPGELALITGTGWQPGETVRLRFQEDPAVHDDYVIDVVADAQGNLRWDQWAPEGHDLGVRFYLMASDSVSKAQTTFTDALKVTVKRSNPNFPNLNVASGSTTPVTFELINANNGGDQSLPVNITYTLTVTGATATGNPLTDSVAIAGNTSIFRTWNIVAPTGPASATVTLSATVNLCPSCTGGSDSYSINVSAPLSDSTPPVITPNITGTLGNNGWYTSNVGLTWTVTDPQSSISSSTGCDPSSVTVDTGSTTFTCSATSAGGTNSASVTIKRDASAPNAPTVSATPAPNASGWNNTNVAVSFASAGDNGPSGVLSCTTSTTLSAETAGTIVSGTCTDNAGNTSTTTTVTVKIDKTAPSLALDPTANVCDTPGLLGWCRGTQTAGFTATESLSGLAAGYSSPFTKSTATNGAAVLIPSGQVCDLADNCAASINAGPFTIDSVVPDSTHPGPDSCDVPGSSGWCRGTQTATFAASDATSGLAAGVTSPFTQSTAVNGAAVMIASGQVCDAAGNCAASIDAGPFKIDSIAPGAPTAGFSVPANGNGWHNTDVTVSFTAGAESGSGIASCTAPTTLSAETAGTVVSGTCTDNAGNTSTTTTVTVKIDKTAPLLALDPTANVCDTPGLLGWCRGTQTAGFTATENLSGLAAGYSSPFTKSTTTNGAAVLIPSGQVCDLAGNCATSINAGPFKIDSLVPELTHPGPDSCDVPGSSGWCRGTQTATFTTSDATSGLAGGVTSPFTQSTAANGTAVSIASGQVCDVAGNCAASIDAGPFKIDSVAPGITFTSRTPDANSFGWNNAAVTVNWECSDATSGPVAAAVSQSVTTEGLNQSSTGTCLDVAGNSASNTQTGISIDKTVPTVAVTGVANGQIYTLGAVPAAACSTTDPLSGVDAAATLAVTGGVPPGVGSFTATCSGATDKAGNASLPVSVSYQVQFAPVGTSCQGAPAHQVLQPVNADGTSVFKQKSTVPVKFRVCDANGVSIGTNVVSTFFLVEVLNGTVVENPNEQPVESTTPDTAFRFDPSGQQWIFNTNTKGLGAPRTYHYRITLTDTTAIDYYFGLK